jgi:hypothetical protein
MGDDKPTNVRVTCDHPGCKATARLDTPGWQISTFGERCPEHHLTLQPVPPRPRKVVVSAHAWTFDPHHSTQRCTACGEVSYAVPLPAGPCTAAPSTWLPPGPDDVPARPVITPEQARNVLVALAEEGLTVDPEGFVVPLDPVDFGLVPECEEPGCESDGEVIDGPRILCREHAPKVDDATLELELFEAPKCHHPLSREDVAALESIKAAVLGKRCEP